MITKPKFNVVATCVAIVALTFCITSDAQAQRGFRIGNVLQAGGGQGLRLGGRRFGARFGGVQGTSIGGQNSGMPFGNGPGARFRGTNYGMQFGGGQGTQIGRLPTTPSVTPGTNYYGDVKNRGYVQPGHVQPGHVQPGHVQPGHVQPVVQARPVMIPSTVASPNDGVEQASFAAPTLAGPAPAGSAETEDSNPDSQDLPEAKSVLEPAATTTTREPVILDEATSPAPTEQPKTVLEAPIE